MPSMKSRERLMGACPILTAVLTTGTPTARHASIWRQTSPNTQRSIAGVSPALVAAFNRAINDVIKEPETAARFAAAGLEPRGSTPEEFAPLVAFLCGEGARYISGTTISVDGALAPGLL